MVVKDPTSWMTIPVNPKWGRKGGDLTLAHMGVSKGPPQNRKTMGEGEGGFSKWNSDPSWKQEIKRKPLPA